MTNQLRIALIQSDLHWESPDANLAMFEELMWQIPEKQDVIVLPETFTTGFSMNPSRFAEPAGGRSFKWMQLMAAQTGAVICGSYIVKEGGRFYNRFYAVFPEGGAYQYDKKHRFSLGGEDQEFTAGTGKLIFKVKGWRVMPLICYDLRFPVWARSVSTTDELYEYDALLYVANWPKPRIHAWDTLLAARAIENTAYCIGVNRTGLDGNGAEHVGHSAVYNFRGEKMVYSDQQQILLATLDRSELLAFREKFPFQSDADFFELR